MNTPSDACVLVVTYQSPNFATLGYASSTLDGDRPGVETTPVVDDVYPDQSTTPETAAKLTAALQAAHAAALAAFREAYGQP